MKSNSAWTTSIFLHIFLIATVLLAVVAAAPAQTENETSTTTVSSLEDSWGIEILGVRSTAANYMLDFRYRVINAEKAELLFKRKIRPQLIDQKSGAHMGVYSSPKTGPMRTTNMPKNDRTYFILFANPGRNITVGSKVTVVIGDFNAENITVE